MSGHFATCLFSSCDIYVEEQIPSLSVTFSEVRIQLKTAIIFKLKQVSTIVCSKEETVRRTKLMDILIVDVTAPQRFDLVLIGPVVLLGSRMRVCLLMRMVSTKRWYTSMDGRRCGQVPFAHTQPLGTLHLMPRVRNSAMKGGQFHDIAGQLLSTWASRRGACPAS
jgi:hypothetical protein